MIVTFEFVRVPSVDVVSRSNVLGRTSLRETVFEWAGFQIAGHFSMLSSVLIFVGLTSDAMAEVLRKTTLLLAAAKLSWVDAVTNLLFQIMFLTLLFLSLSRIYTHDAPLLRTYYCVVFNMYTRSIQLSRFNFHCLIRQCLQHFSDLL